jgi:hypothetical protein
MQAALSRHVICQINMKFSENMLSNKANNITYIEIAENIQYQSLLPEMKQSSNINVSQTLITPPPTLYSKKKTILYAEILVTLVLNRAVSLSPKEFSGNMELDQPLFSSKDNVTNKIATFFKKTRKERKKIVFMLTRVLTGFQSHD